MSVGGTLGRVNIGSVGSRGMGVGVEGSGVAAADMVAVVVVNSGN